MRGYKNGYLTKSAITTEIKRVIAKTHNIRYSDIVINWLSNWKVTKYPTGLIQKSGKIRLHAVGFTSRNYFVFQQINCKWYMY